MKPRCAIAVLLIALTLSDGTQGQRHLPQTQVFRSPGRVLLDTQVESPAVYDGSGPVRRVSAGESFEVQVFAPTAARMRVYEYGFSVERPPGVDVPLVITDARDWDDLPLTSGKPNQTLIFSATRFGIAPLPATGHAMTVTFTATDDLPQLAPLVVTLTVTVVSDPPRRVNQIVGRQLLTWS